MDIKINVTERPWGYYIKFLEEAGVWVKRVEVKPFGSIVLRRVKNRRIVLPRVSPENRDTISHPREVSYANAGSIHAILSPFGLVRDGPGGPGYHPPLTAGTPGAKFCPQCGGTLPQPQNGHGHPGRKPQHSGGARRDKQLQALGEPAPESRECERQHPILGAPERQHQTGQGRRP